MLSQYYQLNFMVAVIRLVLFYLLVAEGGSQTGSTQGNSSPRGSPRGHGCNGRRSGHGSGQDTINDAFADTSVCDHADLSNRVDPPYTLGQASRSQRVLNPLCLQAPKLIFNQAMPVEPTSQIQMRRAIWI